MTFAGGKSRPTVAVCVSGVDSEWRTKTGLGIIDGAYEHRIDTVFFTSHCSNDSVNDERDEGELAVFDFMNMSLFDAVVILQITIPDKERVDKIIKDAHAAGIPTITIQHHIQYENNFNISLCDDGAISTIVSHLIEHHGFSKINFIGGHPGEYESEMRLSAYRDTLTEHGIEIDERRIGYGRFYIPKAEEAVRDFLKCGLPLPQAIVCANDTMAMAAIAELQRNGLKVPEDVAVTGFDGIDEAMCHSPQITTGARPYRTAGRLIMQMLADYFYRGIPMSDRSVSNEMIITESCGCTPDDVRNINSLMHDQYINTDNAHVKIRRFTRMSEDLTLAGDMNYLYDKLHDYIRGLNCERFSICLTDSFMEELTSDTADISSAEDLSVRPVMTEPLNDCGITVPMDYCGWDMLPGYSFRSSRLLPALFEGEDTKVYFLCPLHFRKDIFGYAIMSRWYLEGDQFLYSAFLQHLCNAYENLRIQCSLRRLVNKLEDMYIRDSLTNLFNRRGFYRHLRHLVPTCRDSETPIMILSVDLDDLKGINDNFGHDNGDIAIKAISDALHSTAREADICARFGGDEFVVAGINYSEKDCQKFVETITRTLNEFNERENLPYKVTASIGWVCDIPESVIMIDELIKAADAKMYKEKSTHKKKPLFFMKGDKKA